VFSELGQDDGALGGVRRSDSGASVAAMAGVDAGRARRTVAASTSYRRAAGGARRCCGARGRCRARGDGSTRRLPGVKEMTRQSFGRRWRGRSSQSQRDVFTAIAQGRSTSGKRNSIYRSSRKVPARTSAPSRGASIPRGLHLDGFIAAVRWIRAAPGRAAVWPASAAACRDFVQEQRAAMGLFELPEVTRPP